jgi:hypothetical protein
MMRALLTGTEVESTLEACGGWGRSPAESMVSGGGGNVRGK